MVTYRTENDEMSSGRLSPITALRYNHPTAAKAPPARSVPE